MTLAPGAVEPLATSISSELPVLVTSTGRPGVPLAGTLPVHTMLSMPSAPTELDSFWAENPSLKRVQKSIAAFSVARTGPLS